MLRLLSIMMVALLVGCAGSAGAPTEAPPDPLDLVKEAATNIRSADTFRISVDQTGPDYKILTEYATVYFRRATAQYVSPGEMQATIRVIAGGIPIEVEVFSRAAEQWYRAIWTGNRWVNQPFAPGFNPETLIAEDTGIEAALKSLIDLSYVGEEQLENGASVYHLSATADGSDVSALLGGLIEPVGIVNVDVYIDTTTRYPVRFMITEHDSPYAVTPEPGQEAEPVVWTIDVYDLNAPAELSTPEASSTEEATAEATANASAPAINAPGITPPMNGGGTAEATPDTTAESGS